MGVCVFRVVAGFLGVWGWWVGWICVGVWWGVLLFESPPLLRKVCDRPPDKRPGNWRTFVVCRWTGGGLFGGAGYRGNVDLLSSAGAGKFEKLLRSDPRLRLWWCRVCLLFENSIVCQVC